MQAHCALAKGIYAITPDGRDFGYVLSVCEGLLAEGLSALQYRNKSSQPVSVRRQHLRLLKDACEQSGTPLIVNDDLALATEFDCGLHLGAQDGDITAARQRLRVNAVLGASCYDQPSLALRAVADGASYVAHGAFYRSRTKPSAAVAGMDLLAAKLPPGVAKVAIGGIQPCHVSTLVSAGADLVAVVDGLFGAPDPVVALRSYRTAFFSSIGPLSL